MKQIPLYLICLSLITLQISCVPDSHQEIENGVIVKLPAYDKGVAHKVKIEVINQNIFRVSATPESTFPNRKSLIIVDQKEDKPRFTLTESKDFIEIATE